MKFTYDAYQKLIRRLKDKGYRIADYKSWQEEERCVILRHDVDTDISKAVKMASIEEMGGKEYLLCTLNIRLL